MIDQQQQQQHPITPPPELVEQLRNCPGTYLKQITIAYQAGADQELEACCEWLCNVERWKTVAEGLRTSRRPKPPSLKEQALAVIENSEICDHLSPEHAAILRRALEALPE